MTFGTCAIVSAGAVGVKVWQDYGDVHGFNSKLALYAEIDVGTAGLLLGPGASFAATKASAAAAGLSAEEWVP